MDVGLALTYKINQWQLPSRELTDKLRMIMLSKKIGAQQAAEQVLRMRQLQEITDIMIQNAPIPRYDYPLQLDL